MQPIQILVIHDDISIRDPLLITLKERFGDENVKLESKSSEGLKYIHNNLSSRMIVLLDFDLGQGEPHAPEVIKKIREETSLVYVIIYTAKQWNQIGNEELVAFINNDALAILQNTADMKTVMTYFDKAAHQLETRVDCILEQWIAKRPDSEKNAPYLTTKSGETHTLNDLVQEIRLETELGQKMEKSILQLAIDLLTTDKRNLMIKVITAFDELDDRLGDYFSNCKNDIAAIIDSENEKESIYEKELISSTNCNRAYIDIYLEGYKFIPFIWLAYMHGNKRSITCNGTGFINAIDDLTYFSNAFFYTNSCLSGKELGLELINQKCSVFIGYDDAIWAFKNQYQEVSRRCDNFGMIYFLTSDGTTYDAFEAMRNNYTIESERIRQFSDPLSAALLINAREALVFHGDKTMKKEDFFHSEPTD